MFIPVIYDNKRMKRFLINIILFIDNKLFKSIKVPTIEPDQKTIYSLKYLKEINKELENKNIPTWITGSWAIAILSNSYFKNINDIDLVTTDKGIKPLCEILELLGYKKGVSKWPNMYMYTKDGVDVEFFSKDNKNHIYYGKRFCEAKVNFENTTFNTLSVNTIKEE